MKKQKRKKTTQSRLLELDIKNINALFNAYGIKVIRFPLFFKLTNESTNVVYDWYIKTGSLMRLSKLYKGCKKVGIYPDPEDAALFIQRDLFVEDNITERYRYLVCKDD
jgi:hypothetical protein